MSKRNFILIEVIGIFLVLCALGWQLLLEDVTQDIYIDGRFLQINQKLDILWSYDSFIGQKLGDLDTAATGTWGDSFTRWSYLDQPMERLDNQVNKFRTIRAIIFFVGTLFVTLGRYGELRDRLNQSLP